MRLPFSSLFRFISVGRFTCVVCLLASKETAESNKFVSAARIEPKREVVSSPSVTSSTASPPPDPKANNKFESPPSYSTPKSPVIVGGVEFAGSAEEARRRMAKKRDIRANTMSIKDKYDLFKKLWSNLSASIQSSLWPAAIYSWNTSGVYSCSNISHSCHVVNYYQSLHRLRTHDLCLKVLIYILNCLNNNYNIVKSFLLLFLLYNLFLKLRCVKRLRITLWCFFVGIYFCLFMFIVD